VYCALTLATGPDFSAYRIRTSIMHMYVSNGLLSSELMHRFGNLDAVWHAVGRKVFFFKPSVTSSIANERFYNVGLLLLSLLLLLLYSPLFNKLFFPPVRT